MPQRQSSHYDWLIENVRIASFDDEPDGSVDSGVTQTVAVRDGTIQRIVDGGIGEVTADQRMDARGMSLTPGLIDCHTHLVFGGNRAREFEWRLQGESYESIARRGGGIVSSVKATRALTDAELFAQSAHRLERLLEEGVTTVEIKSGYGLDFETELKMLRVARQLGKKYPVTVKTTFLGAHALPPEYPSTESGKQDYIDHVCNNMLPAIAESGLADAVDVFCEGIGFNVAQCTQVFNAATQYGLPIKAHVEQLSNLHGAVNAAQHRALSVDHLEYLTDDDVPALAKTVAVLLPAAYYCLNETQLPPIAALRKHKIPMAVASDLNPGTAPIASLLTVLNQACVLFGLTPKEVLRGATVHAAAALGLAHTGRIKSGYDADLLLWDIQHPAELVYGVNFHRPVAVWQAGRLVKQ